MYLSEILDQSEILEQSDLGSVVHQSQQYVHTRPTYYLHETLQQAD